MFLIWLPLTCKQIINKLNQIQNKNYYIFWINFNTSTSMHLGKKASNRLISMNRIHTQKIV